jgi:hypothetical protein
MPARLNTLIQEHHVTVCRWKQHAGHYRLSRPCAKAADASGIKAVAFFFYGYIKTLTVHIGDGQDFF